LFFQDAQGKYEMGTEEKVGKESEPIPTTLPYAQNKFDPIPYIK
jgi:hypothetical protein